MLIFIILHYMFDTEVVNRSSFELSGMNNYILPAVFYVEYQLLVLTLLIIMLPLCEYTGLSLAPEINLMMTMMNIQQH